VGFHDLDLSERRLIARRGTAFFAQRLAELTDDDLESGSLLDGWTRKHLIAHVGYNAAALCRLMDWAATGVETPMYPSAEHRDREIKEGATLSAAALRNLFDHTVARLDEKWRNLDASRWAAPVRTAQGRTGANQFYGQIETGYRFDLGTAANAFVTPFARLQAYTGTQNALTETGAQSLNLTVAQQTTNSLRSVIGAQLGGSMDLGWREKLAMQLRLGWSHEYADVGRPVTATLSGAPAMPFTTFGISPQRDGVVLGLSANTAIAEATSIYLRYEGDISGQDSAHAITAGLRMTW